MKTKSENFQPLENIEWIYNYIGRSSNPNLTCPTMQIDDFRLYKTSLNDNNITTLFTYKKPEVLLYRMRMVEIIVTVIIIIIIGVYMYS